MPSMNIDGRGVSKSHKRMTLLNFGKSCYILQQHPDKYSSGNTINGRIRVRHAQKCASSLLCGPAKTPGIRYSSINPGTYFIKNIVFMQNKIKRIWRIFVKCFNLRLILL